MPNLVAISFEGEITPSFELRCLLPGARRPDGWGLGYYPAGEPAAAVLKEAAAAHAHLSTEMVQAWGRLESSTFLLHIRNALWGALSDANTQPFSRSWGGREWLFAHSGSLNERPRLTSAEPLFEPVGSTDSEVVFCELMARFAQRRWRSLAEVDLDALGTWLAELNELGTLNLVITDGHDLCVYADRTRGGMHLCYLFPPYERLRLEDADVSIDLARGEVKSRKGVVISSSPIAIDSNLQPEWVQLGKGHLLMLRQGAVRAELATSGASHVSGEPGHRLRKRPTKADPRVMSVTHRTTYRYSKPVERSTHILRLTPMHDRLQRVLDTETRISVDGPSREYDDVFGNRIRRVRLEQPYTELVIEAKSRVELLDVDPLSFRSVRVGTSIPLVWMPWQRQLLNPFLLPPELPETELIELTEYAMSFVERNDYDLTDTLLDLNTTLFKEYAYKPGTTHIATTPFEVYQQRSGVCQDFANLFICLARLLSVPARYMCGYVWAGEANPNQRAAEASHAWLQVYLPEVGWKGFDPTNGTLTQTDHVRVACGRNYLDATPTSGTIFAGGGHETLDVFVRVEPE